MKLNGYKIITESTNVHPLDSKVKSNFGFDIPEDNYHRQVMRELHNIFEEERHVSEKDFKGQDELIKITEGIVRDLNVEIIIDRFKKDNLRPSYCAECIYSKLKLK